MLKKILSKDECKECAFCCAFKRRSLWETPAFSAEDKIFLEKKYGVKFRAGENGGFTFDLSGEFKTGSESEEAPCPFLDKAKGCVLPENEKPFDCKVWPFRAMREGGEIFVAVATSCPAMRRLPFEKIERFARDELSGVFAEKIKEEPFRAKEMKDGYKKAAAIG